MRRRLWAGVVAVWIQLGEQSAVGTFRRVECVESSQQIAIVSDQPCQMTRIITVEWVWW